MFIIIEHNGDYVVGLMINDEGDNATFNTREEAEAFAKENCAFEYKIIKI
jgi:hypothetical protein